MPQGTDSSTFLNAIRDISTSAYQNTVPIATADNIADVGKAVLTAPDYIRNEFMNNLYNKIGLTLIDTPVVTNPYSFLKKGTLEHGQIIEDIYVEMATAQPYETGMKEGSPIPDQFSIKKVDHYSAFYSVINSRQYQQTRHRTDLKKAFHNAGGVEQFISALMQSLVSGENYDDYRMAIAVIARQIEEAVKEETASVVHLLTNYNTLNGTTLTAEKALSDRDFLQYVSNQLQKYSERLSFVRKDYNFAGVNAITPQSSQRLMMLSDVTVDFRTQLLAWAYNGASLELGAIDKIDSWYSISTGGEDGETIYSNPEGIDVKATFTSATTGTSECLAVIYDPDMIKIYNKERIASTAENAKGNYMNFFMSLEDIYAASPYKNFVAFMLD